MDVLMRQIMRVQVLTRRRVFVTGACLGSSFQFERKPYYFQPQCLDNVVVVVVVGGCWDKRGNRWTIRGSRLSKSVTIHFDAG